MDNGAGCDGDRSLAGLGTQMYSNALHPWEHMLGMGLVLFNQLVKWDAQLQQDLDKMLEKAKAANERHYIVDPLGAQVKVLEVASRLGLYVSVSVAVAVAHEMCPSQI